MERKKTYLLAGLLTGLAAFSVLGWSIWPRPGADFDAVAWESPNGKTIWVARHEITVADWNECADADGCTLRLRAKSGQDPAQTPATGLSWVDAVEYLAWANGKAHGALRLPTAVEWQAMAAPVLPPEPDPIFTDPELTWASTYLTEKSYSRALKPRGSHSTTPEGIADLDGPVWEWTSDCYDTSVSADRCPAFVAGGLHESVISLFTRDPARGGCAVGAPPAHLGLRLVSDYPPAG